MESPDTLQEAIIWFSDSERCHRFMLQLRWPDGIVKCPRCGSEKLLWIAKERVWKCYAKHDHTKFSLKTGTIFEDSPIPLEKWLVAAWLIVSCKNGISSYKLHRDLKVTQKTAWFMNHRIRLAMQETRFNKLGGEVEIDETFIGGKARNMHASKGAEKIQSRGPDGKEIAFGMVERGGKVITGHVDTRNKRDLQPMIREHPLHR
jgi:transposase-like protein